MLRTQRQWTKVFGWPRRSDRPATTKALQLGTTVTPWPWITFCVGAMLLILPLGQDLIHGAFFSGEQLSRNIMQPVLAVVVAIWAILVAIEWIVRTLLARRSRR